MVGYTVLTHEVNLFSVFTIFANKLLAFGCKFLIVISLLLTTTAGI